MRRTLQPFDILPSGEMKRAIQGEGADYTSRRWVRAAVLPVGGRGVVVVDPFYWKPRSDCFDLTLRAPAGPAEVWLERWSGRGRRTRFAAARVILAKGAVKTKRRVGTVPVDGGRFLIGCREKLDDWWRVGGPRSKCNVAVDGRTGKAIGKLLAKAGFKMREQWGFPFFDESLDDEGIARANAALARAKRKETVNVCEQHSRAELEDGYENDRPSVLRREKTAYAVVFDTGWGNGIYTWHRLGDGGRKTLGYECRLDP